jgi:hypothetical protein
MAMASSAGVRLEEDDESEVSDEVLVSVGRLLSVEREFFRDCCCCSCCWQLRPKIQVAALIHHADALRSDAVRVSHRGGLDARGPIKPVHHGAAGSPKRAPSKSTSPSAKNRCPAAVRTKA